MSAQHADAKQNFSCGIEALDRYLRHQAGQDYRKRVSAPYVLVTADGRIGGFYTLSAASFGTDDLPGDIVRQLNLPRYPTLGATLIGRLACDLSFQGTGFAQVLLIDALSLALQSSQQIASVAVLVDAKNERAMRFYEKYGFVRFPETPHRLYLPMQTVAKLFVQL